MDQKLLVGFAALCAALLPTLAFAFVSGEGDSYRAVYNKNGVILTSVRPVSRLIGAGARGSVRAGREILYLGKRCDAYSTAFGRGAWGWANGGVLVTFTNGQKIGFPRQEIDNDLSTRYGWSIGRCSL